MPPRVFHVANRIINGGIDFVYYVHLSEGLISVSITPQFNGSNYITWSCSTHSALGAKNILAFIDGFILVLDQADLNRYARE